MKKPQRLPRKAAPKDATPKPKPPPVFGGGRRASQIDFSAVKERAEPYIEELLVHLSPDGELRGSQYMMYNPHRVDNNLGSFSFNIENHKWKDFADPDEASGSDIISVAAYIWKVNQMKAARRISDLVDVFCKKVTVPPSKTAASTKGKSATKPDADPGIAVVPVPDDAGDPLAFHFGLQPTARYVYTDEAGKLVCFVDRFDPKGKRKYFTPQTYRQMPDGSFKWRWKGLDVAWPLYNLFELTQRSDANVVIVEGEKAAEAAKGLFPNQVVVTTMHGSQSPGKSDLTPLRGRSIIIWPDNDEAGQGYVEKLSEILFGQDPGANITVLSVPDVSPGTADGKPKLKPGFVAPVGWDAADAVEEGWTAEHIALLLQLGCAKAHIPSEITNELAADSGAKASFTMPPEVVDFLGRTFGENLVYTNEAFFGYSEGYWRALEDLADIKNLIARYYGEDATPKNVESLFTLLQIFRAVATASFKPDHRMICMKNGTLNTATYQLEEHSPLHGLVNKLNIDWDVEATCPRWLQFLQEIFVADADKDQKIEFLQQWIGYCLTPDMDQHKFVWMVGTGGNGKSVVLSVLEALVGRKNVGHAQMERFESGAVRAELEGKLVNVSSEMSATATVSDGYLKQIVGGDAIEAERKFKKPHTFKPTVKLIAATNQLPRLLDMSDGFARRAIILTFNRKFSEAEMDPKLVEQLMTELPGILVWAVKGLKELRQRGKFSIPDSSRVELDKYRKESDPVALFIDECLTPSTTNYETPRRIYESYQSWCRSGNFSPLHKINFGKRMTIHGFTKYRRGGLEYWMVDITEPSLYVDPSATLATDDIREHRPGEDRYKL